MVEAYLQYGDHMKKIIIELPDRAAKEIGRYVQAGWFPSEGEAVRAAVIDFVRHHPIEIVDHIMREDIAWALKQKQRNGAA